MTPNEPLRATIQKFTEAQSTDPAQKLVNVYRVSYTIGPHGPFTLDFPKDGFQGAAVRQKLNEHVAQIVAANA